jgi:hypothetical protein
MVLFEKPIGFTSKSTDFSVTLTVVKKGKFGLKMSKIITWLLLILYNDIRHKCTIDIINATHNKYIAIYNCLTHIVQQLIIQLVLTINMGDIKSTSLALTVRQPSVMYHVVFHGWNECNSCWVDLNPGPVKLSPGLPPQIRWRPDQGTPLIHG